MKRLLKALILVGVGVTIAFGGPIVLTGLLAWGGFKLVNRYSSDGFRDTDRGAESLSGQRKGRYFPSGIPLDMRMGKKSGLFNRNVTYTAAGIEGLVMASPGRNGMVDYSFPVPDEETGLRLQSYIRERGLNASVFHSGDGVFKLECSDIETVNELAKFVYPHREFDVERKTVLSRQYLVDGVASYEEAVEALKANRSNGSYLGSFVSNEDTVNGKRAVRIVEGEPVNETALGGSLHVGSFVVTEREVMRSTGTVSVPYGVEDIPSYSLEHFRSDGPGSKQLPAETEYVQSIPDGIKRYFYSGNRRIGLYEELDPDKLAGDGLKAYVFFNSFDSLQQFVQNGFLPENTFVSVSKKAPSVNEGKFVLGLSFVDPSVRNAVYLQNNLPASTQVKLNSLGYDEHLVEYSRFMDALGQHPSGSVSGVLRSPLMLDSLSLAEVNGLSYYQAKERFSGVGDYPVLSDEQAALWLKDSSLIKSVSIDIDASNRVMRISSVVGDDKKVKSQTEEISLSDSEMLALSRRNKFSMTEMKDFLMQLHPEFFKTYSDGNGRSVLLNPIEAFIAGRKPEEVSSPVKIQQNGQRPVQRKAEAGRKVLSPKIKKSGPKLL